MVPHIAFVGDSGSGKTLLVTRLIAVFRSQGLRVGGVKHTHHEFEIDREGKDSHRMKKAGAQTVLVASPHRVALVRNLERPLGLEEILENYFRGLNLVLVEGFRDSQAPKIAVCRGNARGSSSLSVLASLSNLVAAVTDDHEALEETLPGMPSFAFDAIEELADFVERTLDLRPRGS